MPISKVNIKITPPFDELAEDIQDAIIDGTVRGVNFGIDAIAGTQVESYTASSRPSQPPGSVYNRTFTLQKSSKKKKAKVTNRRVKGVWLSDGSIAPYNIYVLDDKRQANIHRGRWKTDVELATEITPEIVDEMDAAIEMELRQL